MRVKACFRYGDETAEFVGTLEEFAAEKLTPSADLAREKIRQWDGTGTLAVGWWDLTRKG